MQKEVLTEDDRESDGKRKAQMPEVRQQENRETDYQL
jgi:hypothetical protein